MEYFIPKSATVKLPNGATVRLVRGVGEVSDVVADSKLGIELGIKPLEEMTDAEWRAIGRKKPQVEPASVMDGVVRTVSGSASDA